MFTTCYRNIKPFKTIFEGPDSNACLVSPDGVQITFGYKGRDYLVDGKLINVGVDYFFNHVDEIVFYERSFGDSFYVKWISDDLKLLNMSDDNGFLRIDENEQIRIYYRNFRTFKEELQTFGLKNIRIDDNDDYFYIDEHRYYLGPSVQGLSLFELLNDSEKVSVCEFSLGNGKKWIHCLYKERENELLFDIG